MGEDYVRPPLVGVESPGPRAGVWRYRIVFTIVVLALLAVIALVVRAVIGGTDEGNPGVLRAPTTVVTAPTG